MASLASEGRGPGGVGDTKPSPGHADAAQGCVHAYAGEGRCQPALPHNCRRPQPKGLRRKDPMIGEPAVPASSLALASPPSRGHGAERRWEVADCTHRAPRGSAMNTGFAAYPRCPTRSSRPLCRARAMSPLWRRYAPQDGADAGACGGSLEGQPPPQHRARGVHPHAGQGRAGIYAQECTRLHVAMVAMHGMHLHPGQGLHAEALHGRMGRIKERVHGTCMCLCVWPASRARAAPGSSPRCVVARIAPGDSDGSPHASMYAAAATRLA